MLSSDHDPDGLCRKNIWENPIRFLERVGGAFTTPTREDTISEAENQPAEDQHVSTSGGNMERGRQAELGADISLSY